jgi:hypothetical protein
MQRQDYERIRELVVNNHNSPSVRGMLCDGKKLEDCPTETCFQDYLLLQRLEKDVEAPSLNDACFLHNFQH